MSIVDILVANQSECSFMRARDIIFFVSKYHTKASEPSKSIPRYAELSSGEFEVAMSNPKLQSSFERIKSIIKRVGYRDS